MQQEENINYEIIVEKDLSVRQAATLFNIPNSTLRRKVEKLEAKNPNLYLQIKQLWSNKQTTVQRILTDENVLRIADLIINEGLSISKIAKIMNIPRKTIEDNMNKYLKKLDTNKYNQYKEVVELNKSKKIIHKQQDMNALANKIVYLITNYRFSMKELTLYLKEINVEFSDEVIYECVNNYLSHNNKEAYAKMGSIFEDKVYNTVDNYSDDIDQKKK